MFVRINSLDKGDNAVRSVEPDADHMDEPVPNLTPAGPSTDSSKQIQSQTVADTGSDELSSSESSSYSEAEIGPAPTTR